MTSLPEQLPEIVADGKRDAGRIMERLESNYDWRHCPVG